MEHDETASEPILSRDVCTDTIAERGKVKVSQAVPDHCVICLCPISERAITTPCNHYTFDFICLASWLEQRSVCPLCNTEITAIEYDFASPTDFERLAIKPTRPSGRVENASPSRQNRLMHSSQRTPTQRPWGITTPAPSPDLALVRRRHVYKHGLRCLHVGSNRVSRYRDYTPIQFSTSSDLQSRARQWIRRELQVFTFLDPTNERRSHDDEQERGASVGRASNAEFLLSYLIAILKTVDIKGSAGQAQDMLQDFIGRENACLFLHELNSWLRSPYIRVQDWDRHVQYAQKLPGPNGDRCVDYRYAAYRRYAGASE
ncbi:hypothetical protein EJ05DRAFT_511072 [Pseudovirgaria hyperparasitica]|uniref:RING-type E3 ubiquitin transferase n=1 Tax=Pseudovirgaria hyperparasitica TaxID=470096 RepID=A0A6A6W8N6_9PEZI|nr:uncharacterized protein EJ05DRAFT_511072 [Pseudovirgaria hyperparasitica]KAF2758256.1 hypothetical protein EJ05DRAFT_511072 [Pseudovirgaria hyperparasitica]